MKILNTLICAATTMLLASTATGCGNNADTPKNKEKGIQLYSLRHEIGNPELFAANADSVLTLLSDYGYTTIEAANYDDGKFYGLTPDEFKAKLDQHGLTPISSHTTKYLTDYELANADFSESLKWWEQAIADHKAAGMTYIVSPGTNFPRNLYEAKIIADYHNAVGRMVADEGLKYGYHNHSHEFQTIDDSDNVVWYDYFIANTDPENVFFQMDVFWTMMAQQSPVLYFKKYPGRFAMLHIKDKYEIGGSGMVGFDAIFNNADTAGMQDYVVEIEKTDGTGATTIFDLARMSSEYLNALDAVKPTYQSDK